MRSVGKCSSVLQNIALASLKVTSQKTTKERCEPYFRKYTHQVVWIRPEQFVQAAILRRIAVTLTKSLDGRSEL